MRGRGTTTAGVGTKNCITLLLVDKKCTVVTDQFSYLFFVGPRPPTRRRPARLLSTGSSIGTIAVSWISCRPSPVINTTIASTSGRIHCCHMHEYVHVCIASAATSPAFNTSATSEFVGLLRPDPAESGAYGGASGTCTHTKKCSGTLRACI